MCICQICICPFVDWCVCTWERINVSAEASGCLIKANWQTGHILEAQIIFWLRPCMCKNSWTWRHVARLERTLLVARKTLSQCGSNNLDYLHLGIVANPLTNNLTTFTTILFNNAGQTTVTSLKSVLCCTRLRSTLPVHGEKGKLSCLLSMVGCPGWRGWDPVEVGSMDGGNRSLLVPYRVGPSALTSLDSAPWRSACRFCCNCWLKLSLFGPRQALVPAGRSPLSARGEEESSAAPRLFLSAWWKGDCRFCLGAGWPINGLFAWTHTGVWKNGCWTLAMLVSLNVRWLTWCSCPKNI